MSNEDYKTIRITNESYEKLRELKFKENKAYVEILKECIDERYEDMKKGEGK